MGKKKVKYPCPPDLDPRFWDSDLGYFNENEYSWHLWFKIPREERLKIIGKDHPDRDAYV